MNQSVISENRLNIYFYMPGDHYNQRLNRFRNLYTIALNDENFRLNKDDTNNMIRFVLSRRSVINTTFPYNFDMLFHYLVFIFESMHTIQEYNVYLNDVLRLFELHPQQPSIVAGFLLKIINLYNSREYRREESVHQIFINVLTNLIEGVPIPESLFVYNMNISNVRFAYYSSLRMLLHYSVGIFRNLQDLTPESQTLIQNIENAITAMNNQIHTWYSTMTMRLGVIQLLMRHDHALGIGVAPPDFGNNGNNLNEIIDNGDREYQQALNNSLYETRIGGSYIYHIELNSAAFVITDENSENNKIDLIKNFLYNFCGFVFKRKKNKITIIDTREEQDDFFNSVTNSSYDTLINILKLQVVYNMYFEINSYHMFNSLLDNSEKDFNKKDFLMLVKRLSKIPEADYKLINQSSTEHFIKSHMFRFLFFLLEKREHYTETNLEIDLNNLKRILIRENPNIIEKINNDFEMIIKCIKENLVLLNRIRAEFFSQVYQTGEDKNCFVFNCAAFCSSNECKSDDDDDEDNDPQNYFTLLTCGHSMHRICARAHSQSNSKSRVLSSLSTKYVKCALCVIECPQCKHLSYIYY